MSKSKTETERGGREETATGRKGRNSEGRWAREMGEGSPGAGSDRLHLEFRSKP